MPHYFKDILVVTFDELAPFYSYSTLAQKLYRAEKRGYGIKRVMLGGNERQLLVDFDTLPNNIKTAIGDPRQTGHPLEQFYKTEKETIDFYTHFKFNDGTYIKDDIQSKYITNASVLRAVSLLKQAREQERLNKNGSLVGIMRTLSDDANSFNGILRKKYEIEHTLPENYRRFTDTFRKFLAEGYPSLIHGNHKNENAVVANDDVVLLLNSMFSEPAYKPNAAEISRQYESFLCGYTEVLQYDQKTGEVIGVYDPKEFRKLSESTIRSYLDKWENRIATHSVRSGDRQKLMAKYKPHHSLEQPKFAGSIISIDDRQPPFEYAKGQRMWFYNGIDLASEAFTTWVYGKTKEGIILDFYRQMVRNYHECGLNLPAELECESSLNSSFKSTFLKEGSMFQYVRIEANNARGKRIEAYYGQLRYKLEKSREGWLSRPFAISESNQAGGAQVPLIPYENIVKGCLKDIETWNNSPHSVKKDKTRWEVFIENQNKDLKPTNYKAFLRYLGYKSSTSCKLGIIRFNNNEWLLGDNGEIYLGEQLIDLMVQIEGQDVDVYWIDDNDGNVIKALVYMGDQLICEAIKKPSYNRARIEQTDNDLENRELMSKYVASIDGYKNRKVKTLQRVMVINEKPATLNNNFKIRELQSETVQNDNTGAILPDPEEWDHKTDNETRFNAPLKDRY